MSRRACFALIVLASLAHGAPFEMRREPVLSFALDEALLRSGGVQYFYELARDKPSPEVSSAAFAWFRALDVHGFWNRSEPLHVVMSRIVYDVDKDVSFFSDVRVHDIAYIDAVAPEYKVKALEDGGYLATKTPSNAFSITRLAGASLQRSPWAPAIAQLTAGFPGVGAEVVVFQENHDFARVMGVRTGALSVTWTAHVRLGPGRTRLIVHTMSYLHSLPPFFLGGEERVFRESVNGARELIERLRAYQP